MYFLLNSCIYCCEAAAVIPNEAKKFFANGTAILLNKDLKNPPD